MPRCCHQPISSLVKVPAPVTFLRPLEYSEHSYYQPAGIKTTDSSEFVQTDPGRSAKPLRPSGLILLDTMILRWTRGQGTVPGLHSHDNLAIW